MKVNAPWIQEEWKDNAKPSEAEPTAKAKPKNGDRWRELNAFAYATQRHLTRSELGVWVSLFCHTDTATGLTSVSLNNLAVEVGADRSTIKIAVKSLMKGLLEQVSKGCNLTYRASVYRTKATMGA